MIEQFLPYCLAERLIRAREGTSDYLAWAGRGRIRKSPWYWMPYAVIRKWQEMKEARRLRKRPVAPQPVDRVQTSGFDFADMSVLDRIAAARDDAGARHREARIVVCLHFFYPDLWPVVRKYLENLTPYRWTLFVTYPDFLPATALEEIRRFRPDATFLACRNAGFDVGPFVEALNRIDLDQADVVVKLQTKGCRREQIFIYDQVFRRADWMLNLYDGVLGGPAVHEAVGALVEGRAALVAAENLIVRDPAHKRHYVKAFCAARGWPFEDDYRFVAGTCFAMRADALKPLKALGLSLADFEGTVRGDFSLAHAVERVMCFGARGRMLGVPVVRDEHAEARDALRATSPLRLLGDPRFEIDPEFMYRVLEFTRIGRYEVARVKLGDIRRVWFDNRVYGLDACAPYRFLSGEQGAYDRYCAENNARQSYFKTTAERFAELRESMEEYDPKRMPIVFGERNVVLDGQHRACILLKRFGPDREIEVLRIFGGGNG